jgi:cytochrome c-type biogenesis protein CcmF
MPAFYLITSLWGGHAGSLLFWTWILSMFATATALIYRDRHRELMPYVSALLTLAQSFFLFLLVFIANPFEKLPFVPDQGLGLNPLLQNVGMAIHPPNLYLGYVGFSVPWAFAMAALLSGKLDAGWIRATRRWTLLAWLFLSLGVTLGGQWAYVELGWGGYWGWDPVENSSFLPWLTGTAFLHSVIVTERRGMLKVWNMLLIILTYNLAIFGAFVTRSGIIDSVHSFTESAIGPAFLAYIALSLIGSLLLLFRRWDQLHADHQLEAILSKEAAFLLNNLLFLGATFAIFWGNIFPILSEAVRGVKVTVGAPFFNQVSAPIFLAILITMALGMLIAWRRQTMSSLMLSLRAPVSAGIVAAIALWLLGVRLPPALLGLSTCVFVGTVTLREFYQGMQARHRLAGEPYSVALR